MSSPIVKGIMMMFENFINHVLHDIWPTNGQVFKTNFSFLVLKGDIDVVGNT
jgi:hypothetical protein